VQEGPLYTVGARERRRSGVGARAAATDGTVSSGGGNGGKGKRQGRGEDGAAAPFRVEWRGVGGEPVAGGE
jgi:hypothetical protein